MKKTTALLSAFLLVCLLAVGTAAAEEATHVYVSGDFEYTVDADGSAKITNYKEPGTVYSLVVPDSLDGHPVTRIGDWAFHSYSISSVTLPDCLVSFGTGTFAFCDAMEDFIISPYRSGFTTVNGALFNREDRELIAYPAGRTSNAYAIPEGTLSVGPCAFTGNYYLSSITLPDSLRSAGSGAFSAFGLQSLAASPDHPVFAVVDNVLFRREDAALIAFPAEKDAADYAVPQGTRSIASRAFSYCHGLKNITIPDGLTTIGHEAFFECYTLVSITLPDTLLTIGAGTFDSCMSLAGLSLPDGLLAIGDGAFCCCFALTELAVPASVQYVGADAFSGCDALTLIVTRDSYAQEYARENKIPCRIAGSDCL